VASYEETLVSITLDAHEDLAVDTRPPYEGNTPPAGASAAAGFQYRFVRVSGGHQCALYNGTTSGHVAAGVLQNKPQIEDMACTVGIHGITLVEAGGAVDAGAVVGADATGRAVAVGAGVALGVAIYGGDEGELIPVLLRLTSTAVA
jgi:hypothetical protein